MGIFKKIIFDKNKLINFFLLTLVIILALASGWHKAQVDNLEKRNQYLIKEIESLKLQCHLE